MRRGHLGMVCLSVAVCTLLPVGYMTEMKLYNDPYTGREVKYFTHIAINSWIKTERVSSACWPHEKNQQKPWTKNT